MATTLQRLRPPRHAISSSPTVAEFKVGARQSHRSILIRLCWLRKSPDAKTEDLASGIGQLDMPIILSWMEAPSGLVMFMTSSCYRCEGLKDVCTARDGKVKNGPYQIRAGTLRKRMVHSETNNAWNNWSLQAGQLWVPPRQDREVGRQQTGSRGFLCTQSSPESFLSAPAWGDRNPVCRPEAMIGLDHCLWPRESFEP